MDKLNLRNFSSKAQRAINKYYSENLYEVFDHENGFAPYKNLTKEAAQNKVSELTKTWKDANPNRKMIGRRWTVRKMNDSND